MGLENEAFMERTGKDMWQQCERLHSFLLLCLNLVFARRRESSSTPIQSLAGKPSHGGTSLLQVFEVGGERRGEED